jgi:hypothetical protein
MDHRHDIYGLIAEFDEPDALLAAAQRASAQGYRKMNAYAPYPVHGLAEAVGHRRTRLPLVVLIGGIVGGVGGYLLQLWVSAVAYPINVGGRPLNSWPSFIPVTFELTVLCAALAAVLGMLALNGLPEPYHPVFNVPGFELASRNRFFLCIRSNDPAFDVGETRRFLESLGPSKVAEVEW